MHRWIKRSGLAFRAGIAAGLLASLTGLAAWWLWPVHGSGQTADLSLPQASTPQAESTNVLLLGVDGRASVSGSRSDTMMVLSIKDQQVHVLSIPRDTLVSIDGHGESKANSAYTYGGTDLAKQVSGQLLGMTVDHYVKVDLAGFRRLVDLMGGVTYNVPKRMYYRDPTDGLLIDLQPGVQKLDGQKAEQLVRFRHDENGDDITRIGRQQDFMKAMGAQALTTAMLPRLPQLLYTARQYVETDLPLTQQLALAHALYQAQQHGGISQATLPGHGDYVDGISFFLVDQEKLHRLVSNWDSPAGTP